MTGSVSSANDSMACQRDVFEFTDSMNFNHSKLSPPPGLPDLDKPYFHSFDAQDVMFKTLISQTARSALANQDPCSIPDDLREELMRQKRKDDAFKTALCDSFRRNQTCSYGDQCRFAHGVHELRLPQHPRGRNHPKYKTVLCDKFSTTGTCKYGTRCQFIHKLVNPTLLNQASGMPLHNTSTSAANQSLFMPTASADLSIDLNQSLPVLRSDIVRAFARANRLDSTEDSVARMARAFENSFARSSFRH